MTNHTTERKCFNIAEAASYLGVSEKTVRRLVMRGKLSPAKIGRRVVFLLDDLDRLFTGSMQKAA